MCDGKFAVASISACMLQPQAFKFVYSIVGIGATENIREFHGLLAICKCFPAGTSHLHDISVTEANVFLLMNFMLRTCKCFVLHQFPIIQYSMLCAYTFICHLISKHKHSLALTTNLLACFLKDVIIGFLQWKFHGNLTSLTHWLQPCKADFILAPIIKLQHFNYNTLNQC